MADQDSTKPRSSTNPSVPIDETTISHALGSLEDADKSISLDSKTEHELGNIDSVVAKEGDETGDFALLDEAIAELESDKSMIDPNIPTLSDIVEPGSQAMTELDENFTEAEPGTVPTLNHVATEVAAPENEPIAEPAAVVSTPTEIMDPVSQAQEIADPEPSKISVAEEPSTTEPPAANTHSTLEFNKTESPPEEEMFTASELILAEEDPLSTYSRPAPTTEHHVNLGAESTAGLSISIPYSLHSQLSKKIDNLVIEATTSMTNELHHQLTLRLNGLLAQSVESVLPKLIDQMATSLRDEVNGQVKRELPSIINEVLGKTKISKD